MPRSCGAITVACEEKDAVCSLERAYQPAAADDPENEGAVYPPEAIPRKKKQQLHQGLQESEPPELEIELELRCLGSSVFACRKRPEPSTLEAPPPRDLVAGEPGHPGDRNHLHPNGDSTLSPAVPSPNLAVPCIDAGELADPLSREPPELELRRLGSSAFAWYRAPPPPFSLDLEPPSTPDHFPFLPRFFCSRKRPEPSTPEGPPPRDLLAGEPGHPGDRNHLHPNGDSTLSPAVPSPDLAVPCIDAGELVDPLSRG
nr:proteoglycan 4-like [Aegilops tauschii subsp. strangulata]